MSAILSLRESAGVSCAAPAVVVASSRVWRELERNLWLALGCLLAFAWLRECPSYRGYLFAMRVEPVELSFLGELSLVWMVVAKSAYALLLIVPLSLWFTQRGQTRLGRFALSGWVSLLILWLFVDQIVFVMSSHHALDYLQLAAHRDTWQWAGESFPILRGLVLGGGALMTTLWAVFEAVALGDRALTRSRRTSWRRPSWIGSSLLLLFVLLGWPLPRLAIGSGDARLLNDLERNLAWRPLFCRLDHSHSLAAKSDLRNHLSQVYASVKARLCDQPLDHQFQIATTERRHVVWLVVESFRRDLLEPETMPFCARLSQESLLFERHYSNSNMSHYGLFSLLYGRLPFVYDDVLDHRIKPQATELFRNSGYQNTFITSGDCSHWLRMGEFLNRDSFDDLLICQQKSWVERDRQALARVTELLRTDPREQPQFIVCFLVATHFPYEFPPEFRRFEPVATAKDVLAAQNPGTGGGDSAAMRNRQKNSAHFLDAEIQRLVSSMDRSQTLLVMTGDHAESFQDDGCYFHGSRLSDAQTMVPALFWGEGVEPQTIRRMTSHVDVLPTMCSLLTGGRAIPENLHGRSLLELNADSLEQVLLVHGRLKSRDLFERAVLVSPECRLPMLLHSSKGAGLTLLDPVDAKDRTLPSQDFSADSLSHLSLRIEAAFRSLEKHRLASALNVRTQ